jgi:carbamoyltransferase
MTEIVAGFHSGHDCSFAILVDGRPLVHAELERYLRLKEPIDDALKFLFEKYDDSGQIKHFTTGIDLWQGGTERRYPDTWNKALTLSAKNGGKFAVIGHHQSHAANAFFSSNFDEALIITVDGGGEEVDVFGDHKVVAAHVTAWVGNDREIKVVDIISDDGVHQAPNIGGFWSRCTENIFGLSAGYPHGHQAGTIMGMAALGDPEKYYKDFANYLEKGVALNYAYYKELADNSEQEQFDIAAALQRATEVRFRAVLEKYHAVYPSKNLCLSGGVSLNCVMVGKIYEWFEGRIEKVYIDPVPYDAGIALGSARFLWHSMLGNPRIEWKDNSSSYLGFTYGAEKIDEALELFKDRVVVKTVDDNEVVRLLTEKKIISVFGGGSESGRRALGNRSILADPRHADTKDIVNSRVKHRQWFRPFAPSILREEVANWFERDVDSPYMAVAISFKEEKKSEVPAVVHFDGTARLQTVTENDNFWYYNFIKKFGEKTGVPIVLNTSFNDREPIVEIPEDALKCFLGTQIDYLYFFDVGLLVERKIEEM